jgi:hypothetical protein
MAFFTLPIIVLTHLKYGSFTLVGRPC